MKALYIAMVALAFHGEFIGLLLCISGGVSGSRRIQRYGGFVMAACLAIGIWLLVHHH